MFRLRPLPLLLLLTVTSLACGGGSEPPASGGTAVEYTTPSGLQVRLLPNPGSGLVASNVFVGAGSTREDDAVAGSSHFLEHLLFNGTPTRTQEELYAEVDRLGLYNNATTRQEYTHFMMVGPRETFDAALEIQADMLLHSTLPEDKFEKERGIVLEELSKDRDDPGYRRRREIALALHGDEGDFSRPVLGTVESITDLPRPRVLDYYQAQYVPSNMRVLVMGDFDVDEVKARIARVFDAPAGAPRPAPTWPVPTTSILSQRQDDGEDLDLVLELRAPAPGDEDYAAMTLLAHALGGNDGARLQRSLADEPSLEPKALSCGLEHREGATFFTVNARFAAGTDVEAVLARIFSELATVAEYGIGAREWAQARTVALAASVREIEQLHYYALLRGDRIWHSPPGFEASFPQELEESYPRLLPAAKRWLGAPALRIAAVGPERTTERREIDPVALGWVARADANPGSELPGGGVAEQGPPRAGSVQAPSVNVLDNGMTVLHAASPSTRMFALHLLVRDRSAREPAGKAGIADLLHRSLPQGAGNYDREEFASLLDGIGAELKVVDSAFIPYDDYYTTPEFSFVRMDCVDLYWQEALRLLSLMIGEPRLEAEAIDRGREEIYQRVRQDAGRASSVTRQRLREMLYPGHPLASDVYGNGSNLDGIGREQLQGFALDYFDPGQLVLAVVGNIDRQAVLDWLNAHFDAGAASPRAAAQVPPLPLTAASAREVREIGGQQASVRMGRVVEFDPADRAALEVAVMILSQRMQQDLRETRGLAYSLGMGLDVHADRASILASMGTRAENLEEAEPAVAEYFSVGGFEPEAGEVEGVVNRELGRMRMRRVTRLGQAYNLSYDFAYGTGLEQAQEESEAMRAVTAEDVTRVAAKYLAEGPLVRVIGR